MARVTIDDLTGRLDLDKLHAAGTYPGTWDRPKEAAENRAWILDGATAVHRLYTSASQTGRSIVTWVSQLRRNEELATLDHEAA